MSDKPPEKAVDFASVGTDSVELGEVYIVQENVRYEGSRIKTVHHDEKGAIQKARELSDSHRYSGEWDEWSNDRPHILSLQNRDVTFVIKTFYVE